MLAKILNFENKYTVRFSLHSGHVFSGETVRRIGDEHARLANGSVANDNALDGTAGRHDDAAAFLNQL